MQPVKDESEWLAARLGLTPAQWEDLFGLGWGPNASGPGHLRGDPPQLMLRAVDHGVFLGVPVGRRSAEDPSAPVDYHATSEEYVAARDLEQKAPEIVKWMLATRRRRFRWCPCCWQHTAPEWWVLDRCVHCADAPG